MENYIENIELINNYLNKRLSESEIQNFENLLKTDSNFNTLFDEHITFLEGLKRPQLKTEIVKAKQTYIKVKWMKFLGISMVVLTISALIYFNITTDTTTKPKAQPNSNTTAKIVLDSVLPEPVLKDTTRVKDSLKTEKVKVEEQTISSKIELADDITTEVEIPKKSAQTFTIFSEKDTTIICKEGTKLIIKANSFTTKDNHEIAGMLAFNVTEFYKLSDMLLANLTTTSNENVLETAGMLDIEAKQNESILKLKENARIEIIFPSKVKKKNMQLFSGEWKDGIINWTLKKQDVPIVKNEIIEEDIEVPFAVVENAPIFPGCDKGDNNANKACMSEKISEFVNRKFNTDLASELGLSGRQRINVIFKIDKSGKITGIRARAPHPGLEKEATRVIGMLPQMKPGKQRGKAVTVPYSLPIIFQVNGTKRIVLNSNNVTTIGTNPTRDSIVNMNFEERLTSNDSANVSVTEVNNYILRSANLGWINCDRFVNSSDKIKYLLKISDYRGTRVNMVFKSISAAIPSRKINGVFYFNNVPNAQEIFLIAIKKDKGILYFDIVETKTQPKPNLEFDFKEVTVEELKRELEKLNKSF